MHDNDSDVLDYVLLRCNARSCHTEHHGHVMHFHCQYPHDFKHLRSHKTEHYWRKDQMQKTKDAKTTQEETNEKIQFERDCRPEKAPTCSFGVRTFRTSGK